MKNIFVPAYLIDGELYHSAICYRFNTQAYKTPVWSLKRALLHKLAETKAGRNTLNEAECAEYHKLFGDNIHETPKEAVVEKCLFVVIFRCENTNAAVGLQIIGNDLYVAFKTSNGNAVKAYCNKHKVAILHDTYLATYLTSNVYLNEPFSNKLEHKTMCKYAVEKCLKLKKRSKHFAENLKKAFPDITW